jgi:hypothetical protein
MGMYLVANSSISILIAYPAFRILIASSIPAQRNYLHTSQESNKLELLSLLGLIQRMYRGLDFFKVKIRLLSCVWNWLERELPIIELPPGFPLALEPRLVDEEVIIYSIC